VCSALGAHILLRERRPIWNLNLNMPAKRVKSGILNRCNRERIESGNNETK
jgi:hypothetical protein